MPSPAWPIWIVKEALTGPTTCSALASSCTVSASNGGSSGVLLLKFYILAFVVSFGVGYLIVRWEHLHARFTGDVALRGSHKVHAISVSRIGGVSIVSGWLVSIVGS